MAITMDSIHSKCSKPKVELIMSNEAKKSIEAKKVAVVIPHFHAPQALEVAIAHLKAQRGVEVDIYVHDNSANNILFTKAINIGLRRFAYADTYDFVLVLNQDANLHPECLAQLLLSMEQDPRAGICAPIALSSDKSVNWAGSGDAFPWGRHLSYDLTKLPHAPFETYWINGACMLLRTNMIREIGLLDENMRFICSDGDYSFTARSRGWKCIVVPNAFVEHELAGSSDVENAWLNKVKWEDQLYFAKKWITGDLYKQLALEGPKLNDENVKAVLAETQRQIDLLTQQINAL